MAFLNGLLASRRRQLAVEEGGLAARAVGYEVGMAHGFSGC